jgi:phosphohistidine phosphatase
MTTFQLYFVRHGLAGQLGDYEDDAVRPLTDEGLKKTRKIAKQLKALEIHADLILTSPYQRAKQTAEILLDVGVGKILEVADSLAPEGDFQTWMTWLTGWRETGQSGMPTTDLSSQPALMLVGHEPDQSHWTEQLLWGKPRGHLIHKKAGIIGLEVPLTGKMLGNCQLFWLCPPRLLGI